MKVSFWHHTADRLPEKSGYYLSYRGWGLGGKGEGDHDYGYLYYHTKYKKWYEYEGSWNSMFPDEVSFVYYWTDATPDEWVDNDPPVSKRKKVQAEMHPAEGEALDNLEEAIKRYETIRALCAK